ncbi:MAG: carbohydrate ABC transporter permease [Anaerolineae bacterium]|jgi:glucose/mannose transport system permease protein
MRLAIYALLILFAILFLVPVYVMVTTSLKTFAEVQDLSRLWGLPQDPNLASFSAAWSGIPDKGLRGLSRNLLNSVNLTIPATIISAMLGSLNGYVLCKWKFRGADVVFPLMLFGMFIPYQSVLIPLTQTLSAIGLGGTLWGLVLVHVVYGIPITTLIFRNYYAEIPNAMLEAARIDGAGILNTYWRVVFPLSLPGFVVVIIWQFTNIWNEFLFAVSVLQKPALQPITVALRNLAGSQIKEWNMVMAGSILAAVPTLLIYVVTGRYFVRGLLAGSVKG